MLEPPHPNRGTGSLAALFGLRHVLFRPARRGARGKKPAAC
jgi:hypothetical protein